MRFSLENGKSKEINETKEVKADIEQLTETEESGENFDDCSLNEVQNGKGKEVNAESLEEAEESYDDCEAKMEEMEKFPPSSRISEVNTGIDVPGKTNYFMDEAKASEVLFPFKQGNWEQLTIREQKQAVEKLADYNAEILGVEDKPRIVYYNAEDSGDFGGYSVKQNAIYINEYNMHDASETADTIFHEYRHKYQHERAEKLETERDFEFKEGFENYIRAEDDYQGYKEQLVESDARAYARVIQDKLDSTFEAIHTDAEQTVEFEENVTSFSDLNPEKGAVWDIRGFLTNDGERITYGEAVNRITGNAEKYMSSINVSEEVKAAAVADMRSELYKQQLEAESRGLGDHGIRHIYGNFERGEKYLASRSDMSDEQKLAVLVAQVYHDEGYTIAPNNLGTLKEGNSDKKHDEASLSKWDESKKLYAGFLDSTTIASIDKAIGEHNIGVKDKVCENERGIALKLDLENNSDAEKAIEGVERIKENTSIEADPIVSTVHICDKLALSQREKFSELLASDPKLVELTEGMNSTLKILQDERFGFYENGELTGQGKKLLDDYHQAINSHIDSKGYDSEYAQRLKDAVNKDVGFNSGRFSSRMNYIYTPSDCYQYNTETGRNEITLFIIEHSDSTLTDLSYKQVDKLFEDLGLSESEMELAKAEAGYDFGDKRGLSVKIETITEEDIRQMESERFQENNDLKEVNECIEAGRKDHREVLQELTEIAALTDGEDLSYNTYCEAAFGVSVVVDFNENEFNSYSSAEKERLVRDIVSGVVLLNASNILNK